MKHHWHIIRPPATPRRSIVVTLTVSISILAALATTTSTIASSSVPQTIKPYVPYAWFALVVILLVGVIITFWNVWYTSGQSTPQSASATPAPRPAAQSINTSFTPAGQQPIAVSSASQPTAPPSSLAPQASQTAGGTTPSQSMPASGTTPASAVSPAPTAESAHYHTCVISYSTNDEPFVTKLSADLKAHGVPCWLADQDGTTGNKLRAEIYQAIDQLDKLLLVLSKNAIESLWVEEEVDVALDREHQQPGTWLLFPLRLDDTVFTTKKYWAITVRQRRIGDFRQWQDDAAYQQALQRVLRDLQV